MHQNRSALYAFVLLIGLLSQYLHVRASEHPLITSKFRFYSQSLHLSFDQSMRELGDIPAKTQDLLTVYGHFDRTQYSYSLRQLEHMKEDLKLNDWLYYELLVRASETVFPEEMKENRVYFQWFMLRKSGYDAQMFFVSDSVYLHVLVDGKQFGFYTIIREGKKYINLTARLKGINLVQRSAMIPKVPEDGSNAAFSMDLSGLPEFDESPIIHKMIAFEHQGEMHRIDVALNRDHVKIMDDYPFADQRLYFQVGLSKAASSSLLPTLKAELAGMNQREQLEFILSFTRTGFLYKEDKEAFGQEKPMTAEQTLFYNWSDCEDRTALFFLLVKELMDLPVIVLDFQTHVGAAVAIDRSEGNYIEYGGRKFTYCEPTGPQNTLAIGEMWEDIRQQKGTVLTEFIPE